MKDQVDPEYGDPCLLAQQGQDGQQVANTGASSSGEPPITAAAFFLSAFVAVVAAATSDSIK